MAAVLARLLRNASASANWCSNRARLLHLAGIGTAPGVRANSFRPAGSVVNAASRIEQANKQFGSSVLVSAEVWSALDAPPHDAIPLGPVPIRGQHAPLELYRLA